MEGGHLVAAELWEGGGRVLEPGAHVGHALVKPGGNLTRLRHDFTKAGVLTNTVLDLDYSFLFNTSHRILIQEVLNFRHSFYFILVFE